MLFSLLARACLLALVITASGCKFSASASGEVKSAEGAEGSAEAEFETEPGTTERSAAEEHIHYKEGKLDYEGTINFEYDKARLRDDAATQQTMGEFREFLEKYSDVEIEIEGHTDSRGSDEYNRDLSDRRAAAVRDWLIEHGIPEQRITAVGKGEDDPQVPEPPECDDKTPTDTSPCEQAWATNRRVVFEVTSGGESIPEEPAPEPEPEPEPEPVAKPEPETEECPWLFGGHLNALGPNSWVVGAGAMQPGICWLEPSLGLGIGFGGISAEVPPTGTEGDGSYLVLNIPLRARFWIWNFGGGHSVIGDAGLGLSQYFVGADMTDSGGITGDYDRDATEFYGHLGAGYGWRPNGAQAGFRLGIVVGALLPFGDLDASTVDTPAGFNAAEEPGLQTSLDNDADELTDLEPYGEVSFGWLF